MKRLRRWLFNASVTISLLLFLSAATFWVRSHWISDGLVWLRYDHGTPRDLVDLYTDSDKFDFSLDSNPGDEFLMADTAKSIGGASFKHFALRVGSFNETWVDGDTGFHLGMYGFVFDRADWFYLALPFWSVMVVATVFPSVAIWRRIRRRKVIGQGRCVVCGYDLRATPERCPECGKAILGAERA